MSTPRKPLPPVIYQRRRAAALILILVVVAALIIAWTVGRGGKDDASQQAAATSSLAQPADAPSSAPSAAPTSSAAEAPASDGAPSAESSAAAPSESAAPSDSAAASEAPKNSCTVDDLKVSVKAVEASYKDGDLPVFVMDVENPTAVDCDIDLDQNKLRFEVYKMGTNARVWADTDCYPSVQTGRTTFKAGATQQFQATWSRKGSEPGQCSDRPVAEAGHYFAHGIIGDNYSEGYTFNLN
ncbi:hypothetical protein HMPREF2976_09095 [Corynebacterium sp. HMSC077D10]|uniref:hypothetical protein n=1 Tax=unclassified Corynebacterium TaxID=2624378 RepID=UPI00082C9947|nr:MULTISPECIES: hypothetical protein [unclassified Corynebacterium]OFL77005.1 hypothetical protein HMPREF2748_05480 [Corynebacterium sp. HMSC077B05]OFP19181.1 hypothetical protein HMPREF2998_10845 [Corynebacterium sp. HMSC065A05]OFP68058.1 hypothetical protein HMPREF2976_09095 [Corynebacterium sp. HMSC077D10]